jgi:hypothetical protein
MVIYLLHRLLVTPLFLRFKGCNFLNIISFISVISDEEPVVRKRSSLDNTKNFGIIKYEYLHG